LEWVKTVSQRRIRRTEFEPERQGEQGGKNEAKKKKDPKWAAEQNRVFVKEPKKPVGCAARSKWPRKNRMFNTAAKGPNKKVREAKSIHLIGKTRGRD